MTGSQKKKIKDAVHQVFALSLGMILLLPIIYALLISFMPARQILSRPPELVPRPVILGNYKMALESTALGRYMLNSLLMAGVSSFLRVVTSAMAAYAFSFYNFKGRNSLFMLFMGTMMIPGDIVLVTNYQTVSRLGLINTYMGMMIIFFCSASNIFLMRQYFLSFSISMKDAAVIDGCGNFHFFLKILMPLSAPVVTTVFISAFIGTWNTYLWPLLVTNDNRMRTVQVGVTMLNFPDGIVYGPVMAASMLVLLPALAVFLVFQKRIVGGIMGGSLKG